MLRTFVLWLVPTPIVLAQSVTLQGSVASMDKKSVEGAVVSLLRSTDSSFVKGALVEADGSFALAGLSTESFRFR